MSGISSLIRFPFGALAAVAILSGCIPNPRSFGMPAGPAARGATSHRKTFKYTGDEQSFKVPAGVTSISVDARGAAGAGYPSPYYPGRGGRVMATIPVQPGQTLAVFVGGEGLRQAGGFNGGGNGGPSSDACTGGLGGGGASDVREGGTTLTDRVLVAGGGGGEGAYVGSGQGDHAGSSGYNGGSGGGKKGGNGQGQPYGDSGGGWGGTQSKGGAGGAAGPDGAPGNSGALGVGGSGGICGYGHYTGSSGSGGGGGYYGGGGGGGGVPLSDDGAGGGGSGYVEPSATNVHFQRGWKHATGNGEIVLSW